MSPRFVDRDVQGSAIVAGIEENLKTRGMQVWNLTIRDEGGLRERGQVKSALYYTTWRCVSARGCYVSSLNREIRLSARVYSCQALYICCHVTKLDAAHRDVIISVTRTAQSHSFGLTTYLHGRFSLSPPLSFCFLPLSFLLSFIHFSRCSLS